MAQGSENSPIAGDQQLVLAEMQKQLARYEEAFASSPFGPEPEEDSLDLRELWNMLVRRRWVIVITTILVVIVAAVYTAMQTPIYRATTVLQIERDTGKVLEYQDVTADESRSNDFYQTQYELLKSRALARRVIDQLGMEQVPRQEKKPGAIEEVKALIMNFISGGADKPAEKSEALPVNLEAHFLANLSVAPVRSSRLVQLHYNSANREQAVLIINTLASSFVDMNLERRFGASTYAKTFLEDRIKQVRADLEDSELALVDYTQARGIIDQEDKQAILMEKLRNMSAAQVQAESQRFEAESRYQEMLGADSGSLVQALNIEIGENIRGLKLQRTDLQTEYRELLEVYKPEYPKMQQLLEQIDQINLEIEQEVLNIREGIKIRYQAKLREEAKLAESITATRNEILALNKRSTDFQTLKREVDTNRELYDGLLQRMKEVGVAAGVTNNNISVVDRAEVPRRQFSPNPRRNLMMGLALGILAGCGLAFLFEILDDTVKTSTGLEKLVGKPVLGIIPKLGGKAAPTGDQMALYSYMEPTSALAEAHRSMRTALMFSTAEGAPKVLHFTSVAAGEGKTTTAVNTAINFAQTGSTVLVIDGDLRNPSLHKVFAVPNDNGLTNYLTGDTEPYRVTQPTGVDNMFVMTAGPVPPNPAELLHGSKMLDLATLASQRFDFVVIDGPPLLGLADALLLADVAKATLFVAAAEHARKDAVEAGIKRLQSSRANVLGAVLTKFDLNKSSYGYGDDYSYSYNYGNESDTRQSA